MLDPGRHGVGAVIVKNNRIVAGGYNGSPPGQPHCDTVGHYMVDDHCIRTLHAELNAIIQCALDGISPHGGELYTTASPCYDCAKMLVRSGLKKVCVGQSYDSRYGMSGKVRNFLNSSGIEYQTVEMCQGDFISRES
jgi:dCMP deaminase